MTMDPASLTPVMAGALSAAGFLGAHAPRLASGLAVGLSMYAQSIVVTSVDTGTLGAGKGTGLGVLVPPAIVPSMIGSFSACGLLGTMSPALATGVANGFMQGFALAIVNTVSAGVGVGAGTGRPIPNPATSLGIFQASLKAAGMLGVSSPQLAAAVSVGLDQVLPSALCILVIAGPPSIYPGLGAGVGFIK